MSPYESGYFAARLGIPSVCNPWNPWLYPGPRMAWASGHYDAIEDTRPRCNPKLEPECVP